MNPGYSETAGLQLVLDHVPAVRLNAIRPISSNTTGQESLNRAVTPRSWSRGKTLHFSSVMRKAEHGPSKYLQLVLPQLDLPKTMANVG